MILNKKQMSEEDIKLQFITPAITSRWDIRKITMETKITDGRVLIGGNLVTRSAPKRADYLLYLNANNPIAVIDNSTSQLLPSRSALTPGWKNSCRCVKS
jgi:type I restriction enzyme R subunit